MVSMYGEVKKLVRKFVDDPVKTIAVAYLLYNILKQYTKEKESYREKLEVLYDNK